MVDYENGGMDGGQQSSGQTGPPGGHDINELLKQIMDISLDRNLDDAQRKYVCLVCYFVLRYWFGFGQVRAIFLIRVRVFLGSSSGWSRVTEKSASLL